MAGIKVFVEEFPYDEREFKTFDDYGNVEAGEYYTAKEIDRNTLWALVNQLADTGLKFNNKPLANIHFTRTRNEEATENCEKGDLEVWLNF